MRQLLGLRRVRTPQRPYDDHTTRLAWQCASLLLSYPDWDTKGTQPGEEDPTTPPERGADDVTSPATLSAGGPGLDEVREVAQGLPRAVGGPLVRLVDWLGAYQGEEAREAYVATFDYTRRCSPYLTYFSTGDTRKRGVALVQFKQAYRRAGVEITDDELPDHVCVVLEFGATVDLEIGWRLLNDHRPGLEVLRLALSERGSPWASAVEAVSATLPTVDGDGWDAVRRLLAEGPPSEDVGLGLDAYSLDPRLNPVPTDPEGVRA